MGYKLLTIESMVMKESKPKMKMEYIYAYATGHVRDENGRPIMIGTPCSKKVYEEQRRINWQTAYKYRAPVGGLRYPINKLPTVLYPPIWGKFLSDRMKHDGTTFDNAYQFQMCAYRCTHRYTAIYRIGSYYFCLAIPRGYRNLSSLKRLI